MVGIALIAQDSFGDAHKLKMRERGDCSPPDRAHRAGRRRR